DVDEGDHFAVGDDALAVGVSDFDEEFAEVAAGGAPHGLLNQFASGSVFELGGLGSDEFGGTSSSAPLDLTQACPRGHLAGAVVGVVADRASQGGLGNCMRFVCGVGVSTDACAACDITRDIVVCV